MDLSKRLVELRKQWNYSQEELAQKLYISRQTISSWENAKTYPDLQSLIILANIYHKSVDDLIKGDIDERKYKAMRQNIRWRYLATIIYLILVYLAFTSIRWIPLTFSLVIIVVLTVLGIENILYLIKFSKKYNLYNIRQILNYLGNTPTYSSKYSRQRLLFQYIIGGILGIAIGLILTALIGIYILQWHF